LLYSYILLIQQKSNIDGNIVEIGVHHGKSFILLSILSNPESEKCVAIDLFEDLQSENIDQSGSGNRQIFMGNLRRFSPNYRNLETITGNTLKIGADTILQKAGGPVRFFSVDGGHTPETTYNDMQLAYRSICEYGVIVVDDYFNEMWPGVSEGVNSFCSDFTVYPFAIGGNKIFFTKSEKYAAIYMADITKMLVYKEPLIDRKLQNRSFYKKIAFRGHEVVAMAKYVKRGLNEQLAYYLYNNHLILRKIRTKLLKK